MTVFKRVIVLTLCVFATIFLLTACGGAIFDNEDVNSGKNFDTGKVSFLSAYNHAKDIGFEGTLEEFIELISGKDGTDGKDGATILKIEFDELGRLVITLTDGTVLAPVEIPERDVHVHNFGEWSDFPGNSIEYCENRLYYRACSSCDAKDFKSGSHSDHIYKTVTTPATCEENGYDTTTCEICGKFEITNEVAALGHSWGKDFRTNETYHWLECDNCDGLINLEQHTLDDNHYCTICNVFVHTEGIVYEISDDGSLMVVGYDGYSSEVVIPAEWQGLPVRHIDDFAFSGCDIISVTIPASIIRIGNGAFDGVNNLEKIHVNDIDSFKNISISDNTLSEMKFIYVNGERVENPLYSIAVIYIIDTSGSMLAFDNFEDSKLYYALLGAEAGLYAFGENDYIGIMSFSNSYTEVLGLTSCAEKNKILGAFDQLRSSVGGGSSGLLNAIFAAGEALSAFNEATEKHIVIITDGGFYDIDSLGDALRENMCLSIQTTIIGIEVTESDSAVIERLLVEYAGMSASDYYNVRDLSSLEVVVYNALLYIKHKRT